MDRPNPTSATGDDGGLGELILLGFCGGGRQRSPLHRPWVQLALGRSEEHTSELQSLRHLVCRLLLEKKKYDYRDFAPRFRAELFDPGPWADVFTRSGAKYVVLTSKHLKGFAFFLMMGAPRSSTLFPNPALFG